MFSEPSIINQEPYSRGWIAIIRPTNLEDELAKLLKPELHAKYVKELAKIDETLPIHKWRKRLEEKTGE